MANSQVGHYELLEKLGEGGMGVVYRARDVALNRYAALKFLPETALDEDRKKRFLQEAQLASSLNHPNIVTIYEISLEPPREFIAMEFVQGRALDSMIGASGLPFKQVLGYAVQIADALAAAHAAGIVHRDVKPGNVLISDAGLAKVLDFGLAKLVERAAQAADDVTRTVAMTSPRTADGLIVGTVSYMSPEQAEGKPADHRSDVFSFGAMLYEMLTGKRAFAGDSVVSTLAAILREEAPDLTRQMPDVPPEFNRLLRRCLEKSPERRWQSMADVRAILEDLKQEPPGSAVRASAAVLVTPARRPVWMYVAVAAVVVAAGLAGLVLWHPRPAELRAESYTFRRMTSDAASNVAPTISADGKMIAYSSDRSQSGTTDIWIQQVAGGEPVRLTSGLGLSHSPSFAPDGSRIVFSGGPDSKGIYVVATFGGEARRIADGRLPSFSPDGTQISYIGPTNDRIMLISPMGGTPKELPLKHSILYRPVWIPDGKRILFLGSAEKGTTGSPDWYTIAVDGGGEQSCGTSQWLHAPFEGLPPHSVSTAGALVYTGEGEATNVYRIPFDLERAKVSGAPVPVTMAPGVTFWPAASADGSKIVFGYTPGFITNLWAMNVDAASGAVTGEAHALTSDQVQRTAPHASLDGKHIVYKATTGRTLEIRVLEVASGKETRIVETSEATAPIISDDGAQIAYGVHEKEGLSIYAVPVSGGVARRLCTGCGRPVEWYDRGARVLYDQAAKNTQVGILDVASGKSTTILQVQGRRIYTPRLSPDQRWITFTLYSDSQDRRIHIARFRGNDPIPEAEWKPLSSAAYLDQRQPFWSPGGGFLYFVSDQDGFLCIWAMRMDAATGKAVGDPFPAYHLHQYRHSLLDFGDAAEIGLSVSGKTMFLAVHELQGNIWLAERKAAPAAR